MEVIQDTYKDTKIGRIPKDWELISFRDLGEYYGGLSGKTKVNFGRGKPYIPFMNIMANDIIDVTYFDLVDVGENEKQNKASKGDIFFNTSSETPEEVGMCAVLLEDISDLYLNSFCFGFRLNEEARKKYLPQYISRFMRSGFGRRLMFPLAQGMTRYNLSKKYFVKLEVPLPPLPEQQKIAAILSTVDEQISTTDKIIEKSKELKKGLMQKLFSEGIGHTEFKDTKIGRIPKDWEVVRLDTVSSKIGDGLHSTPNYTDDSDYYFVNGNNLIKGEIKIKPNTKRVTEEEYIKHKKQLTTSTILMSINGTIGNLAFCNMENIVLGKSAAYINLNTSKINKVFFYYFLQTHQIKLFYLKELTGTTIANLSLKSIRKTPTVLPSNEEQQKIAAILSEADAKIEKEQTQKKQLEQLKKGLMQQLLTGKKRVTI